jgi:hypothetical protein
MRTRISVVSRHRPVAWAVGYAFVAAGFVPKGDFNPVPEAKFVEDDTQMILYHVLRRADGRGYFAIFESLGNELDDLLLAGAGDAGSVKTARGHIRAGV